MVVGQAQLVGRVVVPVRKVDELDGFDAESFVSVGDAGRDKDFTRLESASKNRIDGSKGRGAAAKIIKKNLNHSGNRSPEIGLFGMVVNRLDGAWIGESQRYLNPADVVGNHFCS